MDPCRPDQKREGPSLEGGHLYQTTTRQRLAGTEVIPCRLLE